MAYEVCQVSGPRSGEGVIWRTDASLLTLADSDVASASGRAIVAWSGGSGDGLFETDPHTWMAPAWRSLEERSAALGRVAAGSGVTILVRPHHRHTVGDATACAKFLQMVGWAGEPARDGVPSSAAEYVGVPRLAVVLDIASLIAPGMYARAEDHLKRAADLLGGHPGVAGVLLAQPRPDPEDPDLSLAAPFSQAGPSPVDPEWLVRLVGSAFAGVPFYAFASDAAGLREALREVGEGPPGYHAAHADSAPLETDKRP